MGRLVMVWGVFVMICLFQRSMHLTRHFKSVFLCMLCTHSFNLCVETPILLAELALRLYSVACCKGFLPFFAAKADLSDIFAEARKQLLVFTCNCFVYCFFFFSCLLLARVLQCSRQRVLKQDGKKTLCSST